jgi:hypothetical protein
MTASASRRRRKSSSGGIQDQIIEGVYTVAEDFPRDSSEMMKETRLSLDEQTVLAEASLVARYGEDESPIRPDQIIRKRCANDTCKAVRHQPESHPQC